MSRHLLHSAGVLVALALAGTSAAQANDTAIRFQLDWRFEGPSAPFLMAVERGYFADEGLDVQIDSGSGSAGAINRVASGAYEMGFGDLNALVEFLAENPDAPGIQGVYVVYDGTPAAVFARKDRDIETPADLEGKALAAPAFDTGYRAWGIFAAANDLAADSVEWQNVDPTLRETLLVRGDVDAITGFYFTSLLNLEGRGMGEEDLTILPFSDYGVPLYGNAIIASEAFAEENPEAVEGFLRAFNRALEETLADPDGAIDYVRNRDELIDVEMETRRLKLAIESVIDTEDARANGVGAVDEERLANAIQLVADAYELPSVPTTDQVFNAAFLPPKEQRMIFPEGP
ncbi:ABC transporter substrate-binding protein [Halomonas urumqiensis]|uniref:Thiamine pyrimidine synthase n=1 Tax=Halomonas urumqiensis TaxID=1684789 RepID=A0A2N7UEV6_9GAMM|nr:ABC transporter substrate-binding protein [Halomonas urumqiensis]PMR78989.1 taurine ABC transporter permease [Halomonas urumqiensis]PTB00983.1 taurine ABC transporter permease [Halomonas urumqiensis]GHE22927.1 ABC transporter substrate-binding protein [Halomonas urumqiensis]